MLVSLIGTNGLLASSIGCYCNENSYDLNVFGRSEPKHYAYNCFSSIDLLGKKLNYEELSKSDVVVYAAGAGIQFQSKENLDSIYKLNVTIPVEISNHLKESSFKGTLVTFGSYFEIGENICDNSFDEKGVLLSQLNAPNDYAISKRLLSRFFSSFHASFNFLHFILPTIYGERESNYRLIPYTLRSINSGLPMALTSGEQVRQYIYINDVVEVLFKSIMKQIQSGVYNIAGVENFSVKELVSMLFKLKGKEMPDDIFGKTERVDSGMKVLKLNGDKLFNIIRFEPSSKIFEIAGRYNSLS